MKTIKEIAQRTRKWATLRNNRNRMFSRDLEGMCSIAATKLHMNLEAEGYKPYICFNDEHAFVLCDGQIVDVTATQFGLKPVEIVPLNERQYYFWRISRKFRRLQSAILYQRMNGWPDDQIFGRCDR